MLRAKVLTSQLAAARLSGARAFSWAKTLHQTEQQKQHDPENNTHGNSQKEKKKTHRLRNFFLFTLTTGSLAYGGGVFYAMRNDQFHDLFTEYVPFSDSVVAWVEERKFRSQFSGKFSLPELKKHNKPEDGVVKIGGNSGMSPQDVSEALPHVSALKPGESGKSGESKPTGTTSKASSNSTSKTSSDKASSSPATSKSDTSGSSKHLPLVHLPADADSLVTGAVDSLNKFIQAVNSASTSPGDAAIETISNDLTKLSQAIHSLRANHKQELEKSLENQAGKLASLGEARTEELRKAVALQEEKLTERFHEEQQRIIDLYNKRLLTEIEATKKVVLTHANNKLLAVNAEREKQFAQQIADRVEKERQGRLSQIQQLADSVKSLEELSLAADKIISESENSAKFQSALTALAHELNTAKVPTPLGFYLNRVRDAAGCADGQKENELVKAALDAIPESVWTQGVLSPAQLAARLKLLEPEIRKASLLPPNAGIAGHLGSYIFSTFLWKKSGNPDGNDVESILARAENALGEGRVVDAVSEINQLNGWPKRLAHDWLQEGRKRTEVEFLVDVLSQEGKLRSLK